jgi:hypothetical protein
MLLAAFGALSTQGQAAVEALHPTWARFRATLTPACR